MLDSTLERLFGHSNWANQRLIQACAALTEAKLDARPQSATVGTIRETLLHLVAAQHGYLALLTLPVEERAHAPLKFEDLADSAALSGAGLLTYLKDSERNPEDKLRTKDGYFVAPWVVLVQAVQHAAEHREQVCSMLTALGVAPPEIDGWAYGEDAGGLVLASRSS